MPKKDIVESGYDLSINKYKETVYKKVEYPPTSEIIKDIKKLQAEISDEMEELEKIIND